MCMIVRIQIGERAMSKILRTIALSILVSGMGVSVPSAVSQTASEPEGKMRTYRFQQDDYRRRYKLYTPANITRRDGPRPLVMVIHGGGSSDRGMIKLDKKRWQTLADQHGFYVVYPNAVDKLWDFVEGVISENLDHRVDDLTYFKRVIDGVSARANIDQSRIFATGISRGGQASYYLACNMPDRIRAIMPVAMSLPKFMLDECVQGPPVGIAVMNGTADPQVPYNGGHITVFRKKRGIVLSTDETLTLWRTRNNCTNAPSAKSFVDEPGDQTSVNITEWTRCTGAPVKLFKVNNGGHTWPGGIQYLPPRIVGHAAQDINASEEGWTFFSQF